MLYLKKKKYEVCFGSKIDEETLIKEGAGSDAILCRTAKITARVLEACPSLKIVARHGVGYENVDIQRAEELGIWVTNTPEALSVTVAEHTVGLMLAAAKWIVLGDRETRRNNFSIRDRVQGMDIVGKTLGLVGIGRIGSAVARIASAGFGMKILAYDPFARAIPEKVTQVPDLNEMLGNSDFVSLHLPSTVHKGKDHRGRRVGRFQG